MKFFYDILKIVSDIVKKKKKILQFLHLLFFFTSIYRIYSKKSLKDRMYVFSHLPRKPKQMEGWNLQ